MCMLEVEMSRDDTEDAPLVCVEQALKSKLSDDSKKILSQKRLEFLEDFGSSLASWVNAYNENQTYLKRKDDDGKKESDVKKVKKDSFSEDCYPPGVSPPPKNLKSEVPCKDSSTKNAPAPTKSLSTANVLVAEKSTTVSSSSKENTKIPIIEPYKSSHYRSPRPYFAPVRTYGPPQNVPMQPFFRNRFSAPRENMFSDFHQAMHPNSQQGSFSGPPGPFMDPSRMPFNMPLCLAMDHGFR
ncbi:unnamed protein product [Staurois parvus]|uniref:Uncharacterized protein n=2 Tax=Staurois parvus TaxID=386267 RepID=A0ABN9E4I3_9NEOB|nr:unnamed protein product [Staurois parvus]